jgi:hypothetical protein
VTSSGTCALLCARASQNDKSSCANWKSGKTALAFKWSGSLVLERGSSCRQSLWYLSCSPFYCWATMRRTLRRGVPSIAVREVERIVASIPSSNAWPRFRETVGSVPRTNSRIPIGVVGRGAARGEVGDWRSRLSSNHRRRRVPGLGTYAGPGSLARQHHQIFGRGR